MDVLYTVMHWRLVQAALTGWAVAAAVDWRAFQSWKSFHDAATYDWRTAAWRWFQGAVVGMGTALGFGMV